MRGPVRQRAEGGGGVWPAVFHCRLAASHASLSYIWVTRLFFLSFFSPAYFYIRRDWIRFGDATGGLALTGRAGPAGSLELVEGAAVPLLVVAAGVAPSVAVSRLVRSSTARVTNT